MQLSPDGDPIENIRNPLAYLRIFKGVVIATGSRCYLGHSQNKRPEGICRAWESVKQLEKLQGRWWRWAYWRARHVWEGWLHVKGLIKFDILWRHNLWESCDASGLQWPANLRQDYAEKQEWRVVSPSLPISKDFITCKQTCIWMWCIVHLWLLKRQTHVNATEKWDWMP